MLQMSGHNMFSESMPWPGVSSYLPYAAENTCRPGWCREGRGALSSLRVPGETGPRRGLWWPAGQSATERRVLHLYWSCRSLNDEGYYMSSAVNTDVINESSGSLAERSGGSWSSQCQHEGGGGPKETLNCPKLKLTEWHQNIFTLPKTVCVNQDWSF